MKSYLKKQEIVNSNLRLFKIQWRYLLYQRVIMGLFAIFLVANVLPIAKVEAATITSQYTIYLKSRTFEPKPGIDQEVQTALEKPSEGHYYAMIQFFNLPDKNQHSDLSKAGILLFDYIPKNLWLVGLPIKPIDEQLKELSTATQKNIRWIGSLLLNDKISPDISDGNFGQWAQNKDGTVNLWVTTFAGVDLKKVSEHVVEHGGQVVKTVPILSRLIVQLPKDSLLKLANENSIQWIEQVPPPKEEINDGIRANISADLVHTPLYNGYGLSGAGVQAGIWDGGHVDTHTDFGTRLSFGDAASVSAHATHVAGTMAGGGILNPLYKGVAPEADIISHKWDNPITEHVSTNPDLSQNSWGYGSCSWYGRYNNNAPNYDKIVTGVLAGLTKRIPVIFAAGNERDDGDCGMNPNPPYINYANIMGGAGQTAKNTITVGAINSDDDSMTTFSSWGPTDDGRIKPEIVAPGDETGAAAIMSTLSGNTYGSSAGTSMAAPAVSGSIALLMEQHNKICTDTPLPSTLKALLIHTARDLDDDATSWFNTGPDYASGYGAINIKAAVDMLPFHKEGSINNGQVQEYTILVTQQISNLKVTLVWDDPAASSLADPTLVNNLDLELEAPDGTIYHPWILDPSNPANPATTGIDNINVVEQVSVLVNSTAMTGTWKIRVKGTAVPTGPQKYTLVNQHLANYSNCPSPNGADVWIRDGIYDTGAEPSPNPPGNICTGWWCSIDMVITHNNITPTGLGLPLPAHQNPENGQTNYAYALVRNRGTQPAYNVNVKLYISPASSGLIWPSHWTLLGSSTIPELPAGDTYLIDPVAWSPPGTGHYCMITRLDTPQDPMTVLETSLINDNVKKNNNIIWKNLNIVDLLPNIESNINFIVRKISKAQVPTQVVLRATNEKGKTIRLPKELTTVTLGGLENLSIKQIDGLEMIQGKNGISAKLTGEKGSIYIEMKKDEEQKLNLTFAPTALTQKDLSEKVYFHVEQFEGEKEADGGISYELRLPKGPLSVTLDKFTANAADGKITINWTTGTETNNAGFILWRATPINGQCSTTEASNYKDVRQVKPLVYSKAKDGVLGASYSEEDQNVEPGITYCYGLEDIDYDGKRTFHIDQIISATLN